MDIFHGINYHDARISRRRDFQIDRMTFRAIVEAVHRADDYRSTSRPCASLEQLLIDLQHCSSFALG